MYRLSVFYAAGEGKTFDMEYYRTTHKELVLECLSGVERMEVDKPIDEGAYLAVGHLYFSSMDALQQAMGGPRAGETADDIKNFTNVEPTIQVFEVVG